MKPRTSVRLARINKEVCLGLVREAAVVGRATHLEIGAVWTDGRQPRWMGTSEDEGKNLGDWQAQEGWEGSS